jgi:hypothetical protein
VVFIVLNQEEAKQLVKKYFTEASDKQVEILPEELTREIEVTIHAKIRELVNCERIKNLSDQ